MKKAIGMFRIAVFTCLLVTGAMTLFARQNTEAEPSRVSHFCSLSVTYINPPGGLHECVFSNEYIFLSGSL